VAVINLPAPSTLETTDLSPLLLSVLFSVFFEKNSGRKPEEKEDILATFMLT
jgi:hypothetical protein